MIAVLDYGMGNLRSVLRALERVGGRAAITADPTEAARADALVVPGVGAFGACMRNLRESGLNAVVKDAVTADKAVLGVCVGLQVFAEGSDEGSDPGLGLLPGWVRALPSTVKVPHMGWNEVRWTADHPLTRAVPDGTRMYFVHSYAVDVGADTVGVCEHGRRFSAAMARGRLFGTQFHPEKSGEPGLALYEAFVQEAA